MRLRDIITVRPETFEGRIAYAGFAAVLVLGGLAVWGLIRGDAETVREGLQLLAGAAFTVGAVFSAWWWRRKRT
ncbi:MAG TPA: hypothetical protein ENG98_03430 [Actinobacteria bacterium]|nr:hypothetical protein BMS3Bbin02_00859 [bacterium BMS3Bbin02]HDL42045.1 hypothetical protein [Actinomycetota bacterium]